VLIELLSRHLAKGIIIYSIAVVVVVVVVEVVVAVKTIEAKPMDRLT
jgi:hypothetical protein